MFGDFDFIFLGGEGVVSILKGELVGAVFGEVFLERRGCDFKQDVGFGV